jgi:RNA polymerase sigma-70 factor (ECF subfamily)
MKMWLSRAVASTVVRGEEPRNRIARWSRWFPSTPAVDEARFQADGDPYPRHWREFPEPWPPTDPTDPAVRQWLAEAMDELPDSWRDVVRQRDVQGRGAAEVAASLGVADDQEQAILNRARAFLRERLAQLLTRGDHR